MYNKKIKEISSHGKECKEKWNVHRSFVGKIQHPVWEDTKVYSWQGQARKVDGKEDEINRSLEENSWFPKLSNHCGKVEIQKSTVVDCKVEGRNHDFAGTKRRPSFDNIWAWKDYGWERPEKLNFEWHCCELE